MSPAGTVSPTSSLPILSKLATPTITSLTLALSSEAEIVSSESLLAALSSVAGTVFPTPSSSILLSEQKLSPASSSQIVPSKAVLSLTTLSSVVLSAQKYSLKPSSLIVSSAAMLASSSIPPPSSKISSGRSLLSIPSSSVLSSFLESSGAAVEPTPTSSPSPTPAFSSAPFLASSPSPSQKLVIFSYLSIVM